MNIIDVCYSVDDHFFSAAYESCKILDDRTLSFEYDDNRGGGSFLNKDWFSNYGETYERAVNNYLNSLQKSNIIYYTRIKEMLSRNGLKNELMS